MDLFMPAERVLYDRAYYLSDEAERDYAFEVAEEHGVDVGEVLYSDELMKEVRDALDRDIDLYLDDEIANFDSMLRELKRGEDPEHPAEISVVAMGSVGRWDGPSRGLVAANSLRDLIDGKGSADALVDCRIDRLVDTNGTFSIEASHHDGTAYLDVRLISGVSFDGKGFRLGGELYAPGKMDLDDFHILLGPASLSPRRSQAASASISTCPTARAAASLRSSKPHRKGFAMTTRRLSTCSRMTG